MQDQNHNNTNSQRQKTPLYIECIVQPGKKYQCSLCRKDISSYTFVHVQGMNGQKVSNNSNSNNNQNTNGQCYCVPCFARMKKWPTSYRVVNKMEFPVLEDSWNALEEIYMMEGLEKHGFGNWNEIADYIQTNKTKQDVQRHYTQFYLSSTNFLPDQSRIDISRHASINSKGIKNKHKLNRQTSNSKRMQTINMEKSSSKATGVEIVGYMPLRNDYEFQYDNQAELLLAQMEFNEEDTQEQQELKFRIIELYNKRLTQRNRKKQFVLSRGILNLQKQTQQEKTLPKSQKQIYNMMKIFSRFSIASQHEQLVKGIIRQKQLRQKIQQYKQLHRRGFKTKAQLQQQLQRKKNQTKTKKKNTHQYNFLDSSRNRRANHSQSQQTIKKPSVYFQSTQQVQLLKNLKLSSISYMMIKQTILRQYAKLGTIDRESVLDMFSVERYIVNSVMDYLERNNQISCAN